MLHTLKGALALVFAIGTSPLWAPPDATSAARDLTADPKAAVTALQDPAPTNAKPFSHATHVPRVWSQGHAKPDGALPEQARDCRGCHEFGAGGAVDSPQQSCADCHRDQGVLKLIPQEGWANDMAAQRTSLSRSFHHDTHAILSCRECHGGAEVNKRNGFVDVPDHLPIPTSSLSCEVCHGEPVTPQAIASWELVAGATLPAGLDPKRLRDAFGNINDGRIAPQPGVAMRPFEHEDHLKIEFLSGAQAGLESNCTQCHVRVTSSGISEAGLLTVSAEGCGTCHLGENGDALPSTTRTEERPSASVGTFAHSDHYGFREGARKEGVVAASAYDALADGEDAASCAACHTYVPSQGTGSQGLGSRGVGDFPFSEVQADGSPGGHTYSGCRQCHDGSSAERDLWGTSAGLHGNWDRPAISTPDGAGAEPTQSGACVECHGFGAGPMATNREQVAVARRDVESFGFLGNAHPHLTPAPPGQEAVDCSECHVARSFSDLQSRITQRSFPHDLHLSDPTPSSGASSGATAAATAAECLTCHTTARDADSAAALTEPFDGVTYLLSLTRPAGATDAVGCAPCHRSREVLEFPSRVEQQATTRDVVRFAHGDHAKVECSECHSLDGTAMTTLPASGCTDCHNHEQGDGLDAWLATGSIRGAEVESCASCHRVDETQNGVARSGVPTRRADPAHDSDPRYRASHEVFGGFEGNQYHPVPDDANYQTCSTCHAVDQGADQVRLPAVNHLLATQNGGFHDDAGNFNTEKLACYGCHWRRPGDDWERYTGFANRDGAETAAVRQTFGAQLDKFPGLNAAGMIR